MDRYFPLCQVYYLTCSATVRPKNVNTLPSAMQIKIVVPILIALFSGMIVKACSGLKRKVGAPNKPQRYQAAIR